MPTEQSYIIEAEHIYAAYQDNLALEDVSFNIRKGEFWGILGPNGSGKTTLLKVILGLMKPLSGTVRVWGQTPGQLGSKRDRIGYVPQHATIDLSFPISVYDVVMLGRSRMIGLGKRPGKEDKEAVQEALKRVELSKAANRQIGQLSGGQRQRVMIARSLVTFPEILILDEPTAALDVNATQSFYEWLHKMHHNMNLTMIVVSHDVGVISRHVDTVACLNRRLVAHGIPNEVMGKETLEEMYGCDAIFFRHGEVPHMVVSTGGMPEKKND